MPSGVLTRTDLLELDPAPPPQMGAKSEGKQPAMLIASRLASETYRLNKCIVNIDRVKLDEDRDPLDRRLDIIFPQNSNLLAFASWEIALFFAVLHESLHFCNLLSSPPQSNPRSFFSALFHFSLNIHLLKEAVALKQRFDRHCTVLG